MIAESGAISFFASKNEFRPRLRWLAKRRQTHRHAYSDIERVLAAMRFNTLVLRNFRWPHY